MEDVVMGKSPYQGKRVFLTGHTGFKGSWLALWLEALGAEVWGYALDPPRAGLYERLSPAVARDFRGDVRDLASLKSAVEACRPHFVFHLAAQALVGESYRDPINTLSTNVVGTGNLLEAIRGLDEKVVCVVVTTDKCYENREWEFAYRETDRLGGRDVYSASKAAAELVTSSWRLSFFGESAPIATARGGNVIGGGDFTKGRILPDCIEALSLRRVIEVRNPGSVRPWQHVLDCLGGYLRLGEWLLDPPTSERSFNFGPVRESQRTVREVVEEVLGHWPGDWIDTSSPGAHHEAGRLAVSIERAGAVLDWAPTWHFQDCVRETVDWYRAFHRSGEGELPREITLDQIHRYTEASRLFQDRLEEGGGIVPNH